MPPKPEQHPDWIRAAVIDRAAALNLSGYEIAKRTEGAVSADTVQAYLAGRKSLTSGRLQHVLDVLGLTVAPE